jgi:poly(hydroxyalkanoate) depolymerase family esterase
MNQRPPDGMSEVLRLTRAGRLGDATGLIQRLLRGGSDSSARGPSGPADQTVIDLDPVSVEVHEPRAADPADGARPEAPPREAGQPGAGTRAGAAGAPPRPKPGLKETLRGLAARFAETRPVRAPDPSPEGARFETLAHADGSGRRAYKLYVPASLAGAGGSSPAVPLVVMLHGCTQSPDDFAAGTGMNALAEERGFLVAYPEQPNTANPSRCWNWFKPEDQRRDQGEPALLAGIVREVMRAHPVDPRRVYVAGLSAGGAAAAILAEAYPDLFAAVGIHSGLPAGAARSLPAALAAMRQGAVANRGAPGGRIVPTIVFHGDGDDTVNPRNAEAVVAQVAAGAGGLKPRGPRRGEVEGGRAFSQVEHVDAAGRVLVEQWTIHGAGHAWAGGSAAGSYTDPKGPDASREMLRFFLDNPHVASPA